MTFTVLDVLKGTLPDPMLVYHGEFAKRDDPNDAPVPYDWVRSSGRGGRCFARDYKAGAEYLFLLRRTVARVTGIVSSTGGPAIEESAFTPDWSPLSPTNEQLIGGTSDPWFIWVRRALGKK